MPNLPSRGSNEVDNGCLLQSMARQHASIHKCSDQIMAWSMIMGDYVPPRIQSRIDKLVKSHSMINKETWSL